MNILSIGNSFSEDAQRYLSAIAKSEGDDFYTVNLCIGGCSLELHARNIEEDNAAYTFQENGVIFDRQISIKDALALADWDVVTIQQVSIRSFVEDSYYPYIHTVADCVRANAPGAKLLIHQTWAYEEGSRHVIEVFGEPSSEKMLEKIRVAYSRAAKEIVADGIIPSGELLMMLYKSGIKGLYRDTLHASFGIGRYAIGLLWYRSFTGRSVLNNAFTDLDDPATEDELRVAKQCVESFGKII